MEIRDKYFKYSIEFLAIGSPWKFMRPIQGLSVGAGGLFSNMELRLVFQQCCVTSGVKRNVRDDITPELLIKLVIGQNSKRPS